MEATYQLEDGTHNHAMPTILSELWYVLNKQASNGLSNLGFEEGLKLKKAVLDSPERRWPQDSQEEIQRAVEGLDEGDFWSWEDYLNRVYTCSVFCSDKEWINFGGTSFVHVPTRRYWTSRWSQGRVPDVVREYQNLPPLPDGAGTVGLEG